MAVLEEVQAGAVLHGGSDAAQPRLVVAQICQRTAERRREGLQRGIDGSLAKHISTMQYYKELIEQQDSLQENIETLLGLEEESQKRLKQV